MGISMASLISVIIPTYNSEKFIGQAIQSVLEQTCQPYEIIVIDDGSTDKTKEALIPFIGKITYIFQGNQGPSAARNAGIKAATGDLICFLDADDLWTPDKLARQLAFMEVQPDIGMVCSDHEEFDENGVVLPSFLKKKEETLGPNIIGENSVCNAFRMLLLMNFVSTPTVMVRRVCFESTGLFDEKLWSIEDRDMWLRMAAHFPIACLPGVCCRRRVHSANISKKKELSLQGKITVLEQNWKRFPALVPPGLWRSLLADLYCQFGYHLLQHDRRRAALKAGLRSLGHRMRQGLRNSDRKETSWLMSAGLIPAALLGWKRSRSVWQSFKGWR
jgi:glycosyltransferase involved in cell wall biosynthesis